MPNVYVIGGANGSGKTTVARILLPNFLDVFEYVNADEIAALGINQQLIIDDPETFRQITANPNE